MSGWEGRRDEKRAAQRWWEDHVVGWGQSREGWTPEAAVLTAEEDGCCNGDGQWRLGLKLCQERYFSLPAVSFPWNTVRSHWFAAHPSCYSVQHYIFLQLKAQQYSIFHFRKLWTVVQPITELKKNINNACENIVSSADIHDTLHVISKIISAFL